MARSDTSAEASDARDDRRVLLTWLGGGLVLVLILWSAVTLEIVRDGRAWQHNAERLVAQKAEAQARSLEAMFDDISQISALLAAARKGGADRELLQRQIRSVSANRPIFPFFADSGGGVISARTDALLGRDLSREPLFRDAVAAGSEEVRLYRAIGIGDLAGQTVVRFVRRVDREDGRLDGVLVVTAKESFFRSTVESSATVPDAAIAVWQPEGVLLLSLRGSQRELPAAVRSRLESGEAVAVFSEDPGGADGVQRIVAWRRLSGQPLVVTVSVPLASMMGTAREMRISHLWTAAASTLLILLATLLGARWHLRREALRREREVVSTTFRVAVDGAKEAFYMVRQLPVDGGRDLVFRVEDCNEFASNLSGMSSEEIVGKPFVELFPGLDRGALQQLMLETLRNGFRELELSANGPRPGSPTWLNFSAVRSAGGIAVSARDVTAQKESEQQLRSMALTDALTMLPNRHWLKQNLGARISTARASGHKLALLFIDLDDFKKVNDSLGHAAGDEFLVATAQALRAAVRSGDEVMRLGGDEFTVLVDQVSDRDAVTEIGRQIVDCVAQVDCEAARRGFAGRASVGAAMFPDDAQSDVALMQFADIAMYAAKAGGKSRFCMYSAELANRVQSTLALEQGLRQALAGNELQLYYQPRISARTGVLVSLEALLRWKRTDGSMAEPSQFIPIAEQSDLINDLGKWVMAEACRQIAAWRDGGCGLVSVSINVSARQLRTDDFRVELGRQLATHKLNPSSLALELTESAMVGDDMAVRHELHELRLMGLELHIDDFGTGYSSLSQLQTLDVDAIKIDRSFVNAIGAREQGRVLCEAMVAMGRTLGFRVVAEGVETLTQLRELQAMRCDEIQGHYASEAVPPTLVPALLARSAFFDPLFPVVHRVATSLQSRGWIS